ncbi:MAG: CoA-binding protein [Pseudomonadota bacterium]
MSHFLDRFFSPDSIAIVGATNNPHKLNYQIAGNLINLGFKGKVYPVNPKAKEIMGIRAFGRLQEIPDQIDLVVAAVPAPRTLDIVKDCDQIGVKRVVIVAGGFAEGGPQGQELNRELASFIRERGIRILGPNTLSPVNAAINLAISFQSIKKMRPGDISFVFQSGFYEARLNWIFSHYGVNKLLDTGNKLDINEVDALEYFSQDPGTRVIAMHVEGLRGNGREFFDLLKKISREKPTIILKSGVTQAGSLAAASHTGSMAGENDVIFDGMIKQTAAIRAQTLEDFFDLAKAFQLLDLPQGNRLAIITFSGGLGVMAADHCVMNGLRLARMSRGTTQNLKKIFPPWDIPVNPLDAGACIAFHASNLLDFFKTVFEITRDPNVDCTVIMLPALSVILESSPGPEFHGVRTTTFRDQFTHLLANMKQDGKPFALWRGRMDREEDEWAEVIESTHGIPVFNSAESAIKAFGAMNRYRLKKEFLRSDRFVQHN